MTVFRLTDGVVSSGLSSTCRVFEGGRALSGPVQSSETNRFSCQEVQINFHAHLSNGQRPIQLILFVNLKFGEGCNTAGQAK